MDKNNNVGQQFKNNVHRLFATHTDRQKKNYTVCNLQHTLIDKRTTKYTACLQHADGQRNKVHRLFATHTDRQKNNKAATVSFSAHSVVYNFALTSEKQESSSGPMEQGCKKSCGETRRTF